MPGVAVVVRSDVVLDAEVREHVREDQHRVLGSRVLGVRLDALEGGLRAGALDFELGTKTAISPAAFCANPIVRSFERKLKLVRYWMYSSGRRR
jgi:hypothetical protein